MCEILHRASRMNSWCSSLACVLRCERVELTCSVTDRLTHVDTRMDNEEAPATDAGVSVW
jgi:hypothetical protein